MEDDILNKSESNIVSQVKEKSKRVIQSVSDKTRDIIRNPSDALESTKSAVVNHWKLITLIIVVCLSIWFLIYMLRPNHKRYADLVLNNSNVYRLWDLSTIEMTSSFQTMSEDLPSTEDEMTYIMNIYIEDWNGIPTTGNRELFHHGPSECCEIKEDDVLNVQFDHKTNDLYIHVNTSLNCLQIPYKNAKQIASTKDYLFVIAEDNNNNNDDKNYIFLQNLNGSSCWEKVTYSDSNDDETPNIIGIDTIVYPSSDDDIYVMTEDSPVNIICKLNQVNTPFKGEMPIFDMGKFATFDSSSVRNYNFTSNRLDDTRIVFTYNNIQKIFLENELQDTAYSYSEDGSLLSTLDTKLVGISYYCSPCDNSITNSSEICSEIGQCKSDFSGNILFNSISTDDNKIWGIDSSGKEIYSTQDISSGQWQLKKKIGDGDGDGILSNIHASPYSRHKIWSLYNSGGDTIVIPLSKSTSINVSSKVEIESHPTTQETVTIQNIPIGTPFQLAITLTKKTVEAYVNGKLYGTKVFKGTRLDDNSVKPLRFFGTQSKINGTIHNFIFAPFHVSLESIQGISHTEKPQSVKKESLLKRCASYFF